MKLNYNHLKLLSYSSKLINPHNFLYSYINVLFFNLINSILIKDIFFLNINYGKNIY